MRTSRPALGLSLGTLALGICVALALDANLGPAYRRWLASVVSGFTSADGSRFTVDRLDVLAPLDILFLLALITATRPPSPRVGLGSALGGISLVIAYQMLLASMLVRWSAFHGPLTSADWPSRAISALMSSEAWACPIAVWLYLRSRRTFQRDPRANDSPTRGVSTHPHSTRSTKTSRIHN